VKIVDTNERLHKRISALSSKVLVFPILTSLVKHPHLSRVSAIIISDGDTDLFINYNNIDASYVTDEIDFGIFNEVCVVGLKEFLHHYDYLPTMSDLEMELFHQAKDFDVEERPIYTIFRRRKAPKANDLIPIWKHYEQFQDWKQLWSQNTTPSKFSQLYPKCLNWIEQSGLYTQDGMEYTQYNMFTTTSRPSNTFGGINYAALPKDGDVRKRFISRFEGGKLYQLDFDGYHIRLIAKLIGVDIPLDIKAHKWLADQYGADLKDAKAITFRQLYGGVQDEYKHIPFFSKTSEYIESLWNDFLRNRLTFTPIMSRKIEIIDSLNKNKLFNYILQAVETERNILILDKLSNMRQDRKSLPILYTYDSILFDVDPSDGDEYILEIKKVMESDGFPTDVEIGDNYKDMVKTNL
jgi:hypothetical protein